MRRNLDWAADSVDAAEQDACVDRRRTQGEGSLDSTVQADAGTVDRRLQVFCGAKPGVNMENLILELFAFSRH